MVKNTDQADIKTEVSSMPLIHGHAKCGQVSSEYIAWIEMRRRCRRQRWKDSRYYVDKSISVCPRWGKSFVAFLKDMGPRPHGMTLDRINSKGNYTRSNCRWASWTVQNNNKSNNHFISRGGETLTISGWSLKLGWPKHVIRNRLRQHWKTDKILSSPVRKYAA